MLIKNYLYSYLKIVYVKKEKGQRESENKMRVPWRKIISQAITLSYNNNDNNNLVRDRIVPDLLIASREKSNQYSIYIYIKPSIKRVLDGRRVNS